MRKELCGILARAVGAFVRLRVAGGEMGNRKVDVVVSPPVYVCREGRGGENGRRVLVPAVVVVVEDEW